MRYIPNLLLSCGILTLSIQFLGNLIHDEMNKALICFIGGMGCVGLLAILNEVQELVDSKKTTNKDTINKQKTDLGKCSQCDREAKYETIYKGNLCNTCHDRYIGLEG